MDPGKTYYTYAIGIMNAIHRGLYTYTPQDSAKPVPDLAEGDPEISADGKTVTVKIKKGVMFSKPVSREVEAKDVKYALERAFTANVTERLRARLPRRHQGRAEGGRGRTRRSRASRRRTSTRSC